MDKAIITFSNNETLVVKEGDFLCPIVTTESPEEGIASALGKPYELWGHNHDGLIPSLTELFFKGNYFFIMDEQKTVYNTASIVKIESL